MEGEREIEKKRFRDYFKNPNIYNSGAPQDLRNDKN